jgi:KDO2-lipid IV(A) lauroyltransferase
VGERDAAAVLLGDAGATADNPTAAPQASPTAGRRKPKKKLPDWTHPLIYAGVRTAAAATQIAGVDPSIGAMRTLGGRFANLPFNAERLDRARRNIAWSFPDWTQQRIDRCAVEAYRHLFSLAVEIAAAPRLIAADGYAAYIDVGDLAEALRHLLKSGPCILVTGHCGNWELLGATLAVLGVPVHALYRPLDMKPLDEWTRRTRSARGLVLIDKFGAAQRMPELMDDGAALAFIADQNAGVRGQFVPFFDRLASAYKAIGVMAMRYDAPVLCGQAIRLTGDTNDRDAASPHAGEPNRHFRYRLRVNDVITPDDWADEPDPVFYITARYRRAIEHMVRAAPEQYLWMHRYWKSRPKFERDRKPFPPRLREKIEALPWMTPDRVERMVERSAIDAEEAAAARDAKRKRRGSQDPR